MILTNPKFYKIREVGEETKRKGLQKGLRSAPAHRSAKDIAIRMLEQEGYPTKTAAQAIKAKQTNKKMVKKQEERSKRAKNKRVPPMARKRKEGTERPRGDSEEEPSDEDQDGKESDPMARKRKNGTGRSRGDSEEEPSDEGQDGKENDPMARKRKDGTGKSRGDSEEEPSDEGQDGDESDQSTDFDDLISDGSGNISD
jgi:hypothetical protein